MSAENPKFWGFEGDERLYDNIGDRLAEMAENWDDTPVPETVEVVGFDPMEIVDNWADIHILEDLLERWDEEYGDPDRDGTTPTDEMKAAAKEFVEKIKGMYHVWACKEVTRMTVKVRDFLDEDEIPVRGASS